MRGRWKREWRGAVFALVASMLAPGCALVPDVRHQPQVHNPFPQLHRVAVMPFNNLSEDDTVDGFAAAVAYYTELQQVRGFEVVPVGVTHQQMQQMGFPSFGATANDYRRLGARLGVDAVVVGAVTDFTMYRPPRMGLAVAWYATHPGFHPIPPGYGLEWGGKNDKDIPDSILFEAEFALAREQLATQTPALPTPPIPAESAQTPPKNAQAAAHTPPQPPPDAEALPAPAPGPGPKPGLGPESANQSGIQPAPLPEGWPDPRGFVPAAPRPHKPPLRPQSRPVMTLTRLYDGNNQDFTEKLAEYYYFRDDPRFGGWQAYLTRTDDFVRFCCYLHIREMLASRGGSEKSRVVWRWPIGRYER